MFLIGARPLLLRKIKAYLTRKVHSVTWNRPLFNIAGDISYILIKISQAVV